MNKIYKFLLKINTKIIKLLYERKRECEKKSMCEKKRACVKKRAGMKKKF